ncbi:MAG: hypothetical protein HQL51_10380 [Magnetococcales bacterium]|nr:hypothetical protein [Magnetococcales bacterium]
MGVAMFRPFHGMALGAAALLASASAWAEGGREIPVWPLTAAPTLDGSWQEWPALGAGSPTPIETFPEDSGDEPEAAETAEAAEGKSSAKARRAPRESSLKEWTPQTELLAGVFQGRLYLTVRWRDDAKDDVYKPWQKNGGAFRKGRRKDDMLAVRFPIGGDFHACMISGATYQTDLWLWSAGRSDKAGVADDMIHRYSTKPLEPAVVYERKGQPVYIQKAFDAGQAGWEFTPNPGSSPEEILPGVKLAAASPSGSRGHVQAKGEWKEGGWTVEMARALAVADDPEDVVFPPGGKLPAQIAVFNAGYKMRKEFSRPFLLDFSRIP